jgi:hypothetical protein
VEWKASEHLNFAEYENNRKKVRVNRFLFLLVFVVLVGRGRLVAVVVDGLVAPRILIDRPLLLPVLLLLT